MILVCKTHQVTLTIEGNRRHIQPPPGSYGYPCKLVTEPRPQPGKSGDCVIVKEG